jgi:uncharacterized protein involved in exopolysaccharide biosynthesis
MPEDSQLEQPGDGVPVKRYVAALFRYKLLIALTALTGTVVGILCAAFFIRPQRVWDGTKVIRLRSPVNELGALTDDLTAGAPREALYVEAEIEQFYDHTLLGDVVDGCALGDQQRQLYREFMQTAQGRLRRWLGAAIPFVFRSQEPTEEQYRQLAVRAVAANLVIKPTQLSRGTSPVLSISYANPDRQKVAPVIETLLSVYQEHKRQEVTEGKAATKRRALLQQRFERVEKEYETERRALEKEYDRLGLPFDAEFAHLLTVRQQELLQLEGQLAAANREIGKLEAQIVQLEAQLASILEAGASVLIPKGDSLELQRVLDQYQQYSDRINELELRLNNPEIATSVRQRLQQELATLREDARALGDRINAMRKEKKIRPPEAVRVEWELAYQRAGLEELKKAAEKSAAQKDAKQKELAVLQVSISRVSVLRERFHRVRDRYEQELVRREDRAIYDQARQGMAYYQEVTKRVTVADDPRSLHRLSRSLLVLVAVFGSLAAGCAAAFLKNQVLDSSINNAKEAEQALGLPVLAIIPDVGS